MARKRLKTMEDCRRYMAGLVNRTEDGVIEPQVAGKLGYLINILISAIKDSDLEKRIEVLENSYNNKNSVRGGKNGK